MGLVKVCWTIVSSLLHDSCFGLFSWVKFLSRSVIKVAGSRRRVYAMRVTFSDKVNLSALAQPAPYFPSLFIFGGRTFS